MVPLAPLEKLAIGEIVVGHLLIVVMVYFVYVHATFADWKKDTLFGKIFGFLIALVWPLAIIYCLTPFSKKFNGTSQAHNDNSVSMRNKSRTKKHHK